MLVPRRPTGTARVSASKPPAAVTVHDGVFSAGAWAMLTAAAESSGVYRRADGACTVHEEAIESLLFALGDSATAEVEYWRKSAHVGMEAHRDVDEVAAASWGELRVPLRVLIAYGAVEEGMAAPTVLWCDRNEVEEAAIEEEALEEAEAAAVVGGVHQGDGAASTVGTGKVKAAGGAEVVGMEVVRLEAGEAEAGEAEAGEAEAAKAAKVCGGVLVVVPAVAGRVLTFDGRLLHAVPQPAAEWCGEEAEAEDGETAEAAEAEAEAVGTEAPRLQPRLQPRLRHVLVLNCWQDHAPLQEEEEEWEQEEWEEGLAQEEEGELEVQAQEEKGADSEAEVQVGGEPTRSAGCEPKDAWRAVPILPAPAAVDRPGAALHHHGAPPSDRRYRFRMYAFGSDALLETDVAASRDAFAAALCEPAQPTWLRTETAQPPMKVGVPSREVAREERS